MASRLPRSRSMRREAFLFASVPILFAPAAVWACPPDWNLATPVGWSDDGSLLVERDVTDWTEDGSQILSRYFEWHRLGQASRCLDLNGASESFGSCENTRWVPQIWMYDALDEEHTTAADRMRQRLSAVVSRRFPRSSTRLKPEVVRAEIHWQTPPQPDQDFAARLEVALRQDDGWRPVFEVEVEHAFPDQFVIVDLDPQGRAAWIRLGFEEGDRWETGWLVALPDDLRLSDEDIAGDATTHALYPAPTTRPMAGSDDYVGLPTDISELRTSFGGTRWALRQMLWFDPGNDTLRRLVFRLDHLDPTILQQAEEVMEAARAQTETFLELDDLFHKTLWEVVSRVGTGDPDVDALLVEHGVMPERPDPTVPGLVESERVLPQLLAVANHGAGSLSPELIVLPSDAGFGGDAGVAPLAESYAETPLGACSATDDPALPPSIGLLLVAWGLLIRRRCSRTRRI